MPPFFTADRSISATLQIKPFSELDLWTALSNEHASPTSVSRNGRTQYLYSYLDAIGARSILVEPEYTDGDYLEDFASYYVRCHAPYQRLCKRLHFFKYDHVQLTTALEGAIFASPESEAMKELNSAYLGFIVARPLPEAIIGRTILKTYDSDGGRRHYTCVREYSAHPFGLSLSVDSLPFQEQDTVLAACATVALWSCLHKTSELFGTPSPRPAAITHYATQYFLQTRAIPSHGLNPYQLTNAITRAGLEAEVIDVKPSIPLTSLLYSYLRMQIPVLLGVRMTTGFHAIALTGYSLSSNASTKLEVAPNEKCINMTGSAIDEFYIHDDQVGPFARLIVKPSASYLNATYPITFEGPWKDSKTGAPLTMYPYVVLIPVYNKIRITFLDLQRWMSRLDRVINWLTASMAPRPPYEWDIYLTNTTEVKQSMKTLPSIAPERLLSVLAKQQPRYMWRISLKIAGKVVVEFLADATGMARAMPFNETVWFDDQFQAAFNQMLSANQTRHLAAQILTEAFTKFLTQSSTTP